MALLPNQTPSLDPKLRFIMIMGSSLGSILTFSIFLLISTNSTSNAYTSISDIESSHGSALSVEFFSPKAVSKDEGVFSPLRDQPNLILPPKMSKEQLVRQDCIYINNAVDHELD